MTSSIIFLDFDGVCNSGQWCCKQTDEVIWSKLDPESVKHVNSIVVATKAQVVVSSSWRKINTIDELRNILKEAGFIGEVIDKTPHYLGTGMQRGHEIQFWLDTLSWVPTSIVILDDDSDMAHLKPYLIQTNGTYGLLEEDANKAIDILMHTPYNHKRFDWTTEQLYHGYGD